MANKNYQILIDPDKITLIGVTKVFETTDKVISVSMQDRFLTLNGTNFNVTELNLENGKLCLLGTLTFLKFSKEREKGDFIKKIFK